VIVAEPVLPAVQVISVLVALAVTVLDAGAIVTATV
jgi:hypothetical protein